MNIEWINKGIELLCETSLIVKKYYEDDNAIVDALNSVSKEDLSKCLEYYKTRSGVVIDLRKELINRLFNDEIFTIKSLHELLNNHKQGKENQYKSYKHLYSIFYPPITFYGHKLERKFVSDFIEKLNKDLDLESHVKITSFDFQGPRQQGSDRYWVAIYNKTQENQSTSLQIFIEFFQGTIGYGIYEHKSKNYLKPKVIAKPKDFSYDDMIAYFEEQKELIINDVKEAPILLEIDLESHKLFKISHGSFKANKYKYVIKALENNNWIIIHESTGKGRAEDFKTKVKKGDYVYITLGAKKLIGIARVTSDDYGIVPIEIADAEGWLYRDIEMIQYPTSKNLKDLDSIKAIYPSGNTSLFEIKDKDLLEANEMLFKPYFNTIFNNNDMSSNTNTVTKFKSSQPLNQILYGPPGTGKTYKTKKIAVEIIENIKYSDSIEDREIILEKYDNYINTENICFTTFHQSMSYEDFIEGIKPLMDEDEEKEISYTIQDGIFKTLCQKASDSVSNLNSTDNKGEILFFEKAWTHLIEDYTETSSSSEIFTLPTSTNMGMNVVEITNKGNLLLKPSKGSSLDYTVSYNRMQKLFNAIPDLSTISNIDKEFRKVIGGANSTAYWCVLNYLHNWVKDNGESLKVRTVEGEKRKENHVIIIDEINRGNVSAIFGELITLIEKDKRAEEKEAINITLPYSKTKFSVPNNVFIIGTMNTADRSVEALDTALRRRFSFEEISPNPKLLEEHKFQEVNLNLLLDKINQRIELLVDKDHQIGHSYFFSINSLDDLKLVFKDKIIPLLEEYFYGDLGKIGLVLGENFIEAVKEQNKNILATFKAYDDIDFVSDKKIFRLKSIDEMTEQDFISIYQ